MAKQLVAVNTTKLPKWANGVIAVGSVALVGFIAYVIYKSLKKKSETKAQAQTVQQTKNDLNNYLKKGGILTYANNLSVYNTTANTIANMMDGCELPNTELDVVRTIVRTVKNQGDWLKLQEVFGQRTIDNCGYWTGDTQYTLADLLKEQLDSTQPLVTNENAGFKTDKLQYTNTSDLLAEYFRKQNIQW